MENEYSECQVCGDNALDGFYRDLSKSELSGLIKTFYIHSGGKTITLKDGRKFRVDGMCDVCDHEVIVREVEEYKKRRINENN